LQPFDATDFYYSQAGARFIAGRESIFRRGQTLAWLAARFKLKAVSAVFLSSFLGAVKCLL
jgi:hypothetical protein